MTCFIKLPLQSGSFLSFVVAGELIDFFGEFAYNIIEILWRT